MADMLNSSRDTSLELEPTFALVLKLTLLALALRQTLDATIEIFSSASLNFYYTTRTTLYNFDYSSAFFVHYSRFFGPPIILKIIPELFPE